MTVNARNFLSHNRLEAIEVIQSQSQYACMADDPWVRFTLPSLHPGASSSLYNGSNVAQDFSETHVARRTLRPTLYHRKYAGSTRPAPPFTE